MPTSQEIPHGPALLHEPLLNKGTAFTEAERVALGLEGLLPPHVHTIEEQLERVLDGFRAKTTDLERYLDLSSLEDRNEVLFYRLVLDHLEETMPIIYTPTVGQACQLWSRLFRRPRGLYISLKDRGRIVNILRNWPHPVRVIVVTDGERILGLGDQGVGGMGIPVGKLSLYTACAGIHPRQCLPVMLDVGTDREEYLRDPLYMGLYQKRLRGPEYDDFVAEFVTAVQEVMPKALVQFEDFGNSNAFRLLEIWRDKVCTFNDDIQGTAAVTLAGLLSALRITKKSLTEQKILFLGAGEAGIGIGDLIASAMTGEGLSLEPPKPAEPPKEPRSKVPAFITGGLAVAAAGVGTVFGILALGKQSDFKTSPSADTADTGENFALVADMSFGVAITLGITSAVLFLTNDDEPAKAASAQAPKKASFFKGFTAAPFMTPHGGGAGAAFRF